MTGITLLRADLHSVDHPNENTGKETQCAPSDPVGEGEASGFSESDAVRGQIDQNVEKRRGKDAKARATCSAQESPSLIRVNAHAHFLRAGFVFPPLAVWSRSIRSFPPTPTGAERPAQAAGCIKRGERGIVFFSRSNKSPTHDINDLTRRGPVQFLCRQRHSAPHLTPSPAALSAP